MPVNELAAAFDLLVEGLSEAHAVTVDCGLEARTKLLQAFAEVGKPFATQDVMLRVHLLLAEAAHLGGDHRQCASLCRPVMQAGFDAGAVGTQSFGANRWMYRVRAAVRSAEAARAAGMFDYSLKCLALARSLPRR